MARTITIELPRRVELIYCDDEKSDEWGTWAYSVIRHDGSVKASGELYPLRSDAERSASLHLLDEEP